ncbi:hypothetical protein ACFQHN_25590 [Natrialbaceae archaeon GCM10025896]
MNDAGTRDVQVSTAMNQVEKGELEKLADVYDCSQSAVVRHLVDERYNELFGEIHPDALDRHDVDEDALVLGEVDPDDVDDSLKMDGDGPAQVPAADGESRHNPSPRATRRRTRRQTSRRVARRCRGTS